MKNFFAAVLVLTAFSLVPMGCKSATSTTPPAALAPGALNSFDQSTYQTLMAFQAALNSLNASYKANPTQLATLKTPLDQAATDYNIAELAWQTYHATATTANQQALSASLSTVQSDVTSLNSAVTK